MVPTATATKEKSVKSESTKAKAKSSKTRKAKSQVDKIEIVNEVEIILIDPNKIEIVEELATRWKPIDKKKLVQITEDFSKGNQLQAIGVRRLENGTLQLIFGRTRLEAAKAVVKKKPDFCIQAKVWEGISDKQALEIGLIENVRRFSATPIDLAVAHQKLRDQGMNDRDIAKRFGLTPTWVGQLKRLMTLPDAAKERVHDGRLAVTAAIEMVGLDEADTAKVIEQIDAEAEADESTNGQAGGRRKGKGAKAKAAIRSKKQAAGGGDEPERLIQLTMREVREFFESLTGPAEPEALRKVAKGFIAFASGRKSDKYYETKVLRKYLGGNPAVEQSDDDQPQENDEQPVEQDEAAE